jgi:hypothetical protein
MTLKLVAVQYKPESTHYGLRPRASADAILFEVFWSRTSLKFVWRFFPHDAVDVSIVSVVHKVDDRLAFVLQIFFQKNKE